MGKINPTDEELLRAAMGNFAEAGDSSFMPSDGSINTQGISPEGFDLKRAANAGFEDNISTVQPPVPKPPIPTPTPPIPTDYSANPQTQISRMQQKNVFPHNPAASSVQQIPKHHSNRLWLITVVVLLVFAILGGFMYYATHHNGADNFLPEESETYVEYPDIEQYFSERADIVSITDVSDSKEVLTESEAVQELADRGFADVSVYTEYDLDGTYQEKKELSENSHDKHPMYSAVYLTDSGAVWNISIVAGQVTAVSISDRLQSTDSTSMIISETETITSYDSAGNRFFVTVPHENGATIQTVDRIDTKTLEQLSTGDKR